MTNMVSTASNGARRAVLNLCMVGASLTIGLQAATQCLAHLFRYHSALGSHVRGLYPPWSIVLWASAWHDTSPNAVRIALGIGALVTAALFGAIAYVVGLRQVSLNRHTHGSARWASFKDIRRAGLFGKVGDSVVYLGAVVDRLGRTRYLTHGGPEHVLTFAPTRSGKSLGPVSMTLTSWGSSAFVLDLKGELAQMTSGWRKRYARNKILIYEPAHAASIAWNPLDEIDVDSPSATGDAQNLATLIVDPDGHGLRDHWSKTAQALITGMILYSLHKARQGGPRATLAGIDAELANPSRPIHDLWSEMVAMSDLCPVVAAAGKDMKDRPDEEGGSVLSTAKSFLSLYRDPVVARNTSRSDFQVRDLMHHDSPVTLYLVTQPVDKARLRPLVRLLVNSIVRKLAGRMEFAAQPPKRRWYQWRARPQSVRARANYKHRLLMLLDEFPALGKLPIMEESLAYLAGYGIKVYILIQDVTQLKSREAGYGPDETITSNCHIQTAYPPNRVETAEYLSRLTGVTTVMREQVTLSGSGMQQRSRVMQEVQRPLLTADEAMRLPSPKKAGAVGDIVEPGDMVMYVAGCPAIYGKQALSILDPVFAARRAEPPVAASDRLNH